MIQRIQIMKMESIFQQAHNHLEAVEMIPIASHPLLHAVRIIQHSLPLELEEKGKWGRFLAPRFRRRSPHNTIAGCFLLLDFNRRRTERLLPQREIIMATVEVNGAVEAITAQTPVETTVQSEKVVQPLTHEELLAALRKQVPLRFPARNDCRSSTTSPRRICPRIAT